MPSASGLLVVIFRDKDDLITQLREMGYIDSTAKVLEAGAAEQNRELRIKAAAIVESQASLVYHSEHGLASSSQQQDGLQSSLGKPFPVKAPLPADLVASSSRKLGGRRETNTSKRLMDTYSLERVAILVAEV